MTQITTSEIEEMIRNKMKEKGLPEAEIRDDLVNEIKEKIKSTVGTSKPKEKSQEKIGANKPKEKSQEEVVIDISQEQPTETPGEEPKAVTQTIENDEEEKELMSKKIELKNKEEAIKQKEIELKQKEIELQNKEQEMEYKPELPKIFDKVGPEKVFVFNKTEINTSGESLSEVPIRLVSEPDIKKSMKNLWLEEGKKDAEVYIVKFEKIGDIEFDPFQGTSNYKEQRFELEQNETDSQENIGEPDKRIIDVDNVPERQSDFIDKIEPVSDVTQPLASEAPTNAIDVEAMMKSKIEDILKNYFTK